MVSSPASDSSMNSWATAPPIMPLSDCTTAVSGTPALAKMRR